MSVIRSLSAALALAAGVAVAPAADVQPLSGTWQHLDPAAAAGAAANRMVMRFLPNGSYETRWSAMAGGAPRDDFVLVTGHYWRTGRDSYLAEAEVVMGCTGPGSCQPIPEGAPSLGLGTLKSVRFQLLGEREILANGQRWLRLE
jgi:hypothetical protein